MFDYQQAKTDIETLYDAASKLDGWQKEQAVKFISVGEYGLALDGIAYAYVDNDARMPAKLFELFRDLAARMGLEGDAEFQGVARLAGRS